MPQTTVKKIIENNYGLKISSLIQIKNAFKIKSQNKNYCFKILRYEYGHSLFIISAMLHLQNSGFYKIPKFIKTLDNKYYVQIDNYYGYLSEWIIAEHSDYNNLTDVKISTENIAELHIKSKGFKVTSSMNPRIGWLKWIKTFNTRSNEILDFKRRIELKNYKSQFDLFYMSMMKDELIRASNSIKHLKQSNYISKMKKEILNKSFCHHDTANHNILISNDMKVYIIDFDYCILDTHLHDLASILIRVMKNGKWSLNTAKYILDCYNSVNRLYEDDIPIMSAFMEFPQAYWQVGIQYYWENQPWTEDFFLNKLKKIYMDNNLKQQFIEEFSNFKYNP